MFIFGVDNECKTTSQPSIMEAHA